MRGTGLLGRLAQEGTQPRQPAEVAAKLELSPHPCATSPRAPATANSWANPSLHAGITRATGSLQRFLKLLEGHACKITISQRAGPRSQHVRRAFRCPDCRRWHFGDQRRLPPADTVS